MTAKVNANKSIHPWEHACQLKLRRLDPKGVEVELEPGVNYFVLQLERLGAQTQFSCEGHPNGFYIMFNAPYEVTLRLLLGYFSIQLEGKDYWSLRLRAYPQYKTLQQRNQTLKWAAEAWEAALGRLPAA